MNAMKSVKQRAKHLECIVILDNTFEAIRTLNEMHWSNRRNNEQGLTPYHSEFDLDNQVNLIEQLENEYKFTLNQLL